MPPSKIISAIKNAGRNHEIESKNHKKTMDVNISIAKVGAGHVLRPFLENPSSKNVKKNPTLEQWKQKAPINNEEDQVMGEPKDFLIHSSAENLIAVQPGDKGLEEGEEGCSTPKKKLTFNLPGRSNGKFQGKWADANPFETLNKEAEALGFLKKTPEALEEGWIFQRKKKHKVKIATSRPTTGHLSQLYASLTKVLGEKRG
ncbi:unnamed protein product [Sphagnum balticum]